MAGAPSVARAIRAIQMTEIPPKVWTSDLPHRIKVVYWWDGKTWWRGSGETYEAAARGLDWMLWTCDLW